MRCQAAAADTVGATELDCLAVRHRCKCAAQLLTAVCDAPRQAAAAETPEAWAAVLGGLAELCAALGEPLGGGQAPTSAMGAGGAPDVALFGPGQLAVLAAAAPTAGARADVLRIAGALPALPAAAELGDW